MAKKKPANERKRDANLCIGMGVGVGALGVASAVTLGAVCPVCYFAVPALVGAGCIERYRAGKDQDQPAMQATTDDAAEKN